MYTAQTCLVPEGSWKQELGFYKQGVWDGTKTTLQRQETNILTISSFLVPTVWQDEVSPLLVLPITIRMPGDRCFR